MYKLNCIKWMFVCGLAFRISYVIIIGMSYLQYPHSLLHTDTHCTHIEWERESGAPPTIARSRSLACSLARSLGALAHSHFVINIGWTFWWMSTWYIILWHADMRILPFRLGHTTSELSGTQSTWSERWQKWMVAWTNGWMARQRQGEAALHCEKVTFLFSIILYVREHTDKLL